MDFLCTRTPGSVHSQNTLTHILTLSLICNVPLSAHTQPLVHSFQPTPQAQTAAASGPSPWWGSVWSAHPPTHPWDFPDHSPSPTPVSPFSFPVQPSGVPGRGGVSAGSLPRTTAFLLPLRMGQRGDAGGDRGDVEGTAPQRAAKRLSSWQFVPEAHWSPRPLADAGPRRAPDAERSEAGARGRASQGEGSAASAGPEAGASG